MKGWNRTITWTMAAVLFMATIPAYAEKTTPATDSNSAVPAVPRAIPNLIPYHKFDPPTSTLFDINKLTISGICGCVRNSARTGNSGGPIIWTAR